MIQSLSIRNIALIGQLTVTFHSGLQVLSGETGAGKSIVVDAVKLILGGRADRSLIRSGCDRASVEAIFSIREDSAASGILRREQIEFDCDHVSVYREISAGGKNICRICGVITPIAVLKELCDKMINLHGQSEYQFLADPGKHLHYLDQLGDDAHRERISNVRKSFGEFMRKHQEYQKLVRLDREKETKLEEIGRDLGLIRKANIRNGEEETLLEKQAALKAAEKTAGALRTAYSSLMGGDGGISPLAAVKDASGALKSIRELDPAAEALSERCGTLYYEMEDLAYQVSEKLSALEQDPTQLKRVEDRLDTIRKVRKKFGKDPEEIRKLGERLEEEYAVYSGLEAAMERTGAEYKRLLAAYRADARSLTDSRKEIARVFCRKMTEELRDLGMEHTVMDVLFAEKTDRKPKMPTADGDDQVEFMISPNPGEPLMPLARIASGGELSRLMLAMKVLEAGHTGIESMVFDEIDTGISGKTAQTVAEKMIAISRCHQVICVSHLPQLASAADCQFLVEKSVRDGRTVTDVRELTDEGRAGEIARMISGAGGITGDSLKYARQMLEAAESRKDCIARDSGKNGS